MCWKSERLTLRLRLQGPVLEQPWCQPQQWLAMPSMQRTTLDRVARSSKLAHSRPRIPAQ